jgi:regulator of RNase E activity RraA
VGSCPRRSRDAFTFGAIGEPSRIGEVPAATEGGILADETGVACVPAAGVGEVLARGDRVERREAALLALVPDDAVSSRDQVRAGHR